jgi:hypothetical protein
MNALIEDPSTNALATERGPDGLRLGNDAQLCKAGCTESRPVEGSSVSTNPTPLDPSVHNSPQNTSGAVGEAIGGVGPRASLPEHAIAVIKAYRKSGCAIVTIERPGRPRHRYTVSLKRYHALREWCMFGKHPWRRSGGYMRSSFTAYLWPANSGKGLS